MLAHKCHSVISMRQKKEEVKAGREEGDVGRREVFAY